MLETLILAGLRFLPAAIDAGIAVAPLVKEIVGKGSDGTVKPLSPIAQYAFNVMSQIPMLLDAKAEVGGILKTANEKVGQMIREGNRDPKPEEWDEVNGLIAEKLKLVNAPSA